MCISKLFPPGAPHINRAQRCYDLGNFVEKVCKSCGSHAFRRLKREGWLECDLLTWFEIFPWECAVCRAKRYFRDSGRIPSTRGHL